MFECSNVVLLKVAITKGSLFIPQDTTLYLLTRDLYPITLTITIQRLTVLYHQNEIFVCPIVGTAAEECRVLILPGVLRGRSANPGSDPTSLVVAKRQTHDFA